MVLKKTDCDSRKLGELRAGRHADDDADDESGDADGGVMHAGRRLSAQPAYLLLVYLVTALVPSDTACLASSPGSRRRTAVCTSRDVMVERLL